MRNGFKIAICAAIIAFVLPMLILRPNPKQKSKQSTEEATDQPKADTQVEQAELSVSVLDNDGIVQNFPLNEYLVGVVLSEMPADFELEALKAQAVVARTYTLRRKEIARKHDAADVCMDPGCCQGYRSTEDYLSKGSAESSVDKIRNAVNSTSGVVLTYQGELVEATYFSCSGGMTEDASAVWGSDVPYLKATESPGEEKATHYTDTVQFTSGQFSEMLGIQATGSPANWIEHVSYTNGGGVESMEICGSVFSGTELRKLLGLRSTAFRLTVVGETVTITTKGYGHRVGMSQYGADAMAVNGASYEEILKHYYQGVQISVYKAE